MILLKLSLLKFLVFLKLFFVLILKINLGLWQGCHNLLKVLFFHGYRRMLSNRNNFPNWFFILRSFLLFRYFIIILILMFVKSVFKVSFQLPDSLLNIIDTLFLFIRFFPQRLKLPVFWKHWVISRMFLLLRTIIILFWLILLIQRIFLLLRILLRVTIWIRILVLLLWG